MKYIRSGRYVGYNEKEYYLSNYGYIGDEENRDKPDGYYICIDDEEDKEEDWYEELSGTEYAYYSKPAKAEEIEYLYEISHYVICNGRKYKWFDYYPDKKGLWVYAASWGSNTKIDPKYEVVESGRDGIYIEVPYDEVTLYETKTFFDKYKYLNEDIEEVLSEETYLIDEPWWFEETKDN